jgi:hypothetical protein
MFLFLFIQRRQESIFQWNGIASIPAVCTCRNYHFNKSNATGTINVAETAYPSGVHEFTAFISRDRVAELYSFSIY